MRSFYIVLLFLLTAFAGSVFGQNDPQFSLFTFNPTYYNPAAVGSEGTARVQITHRTQWAGYQGTTDDGGAPSTQLLSFNTPLTKYKSGIGVYALNDQYGPLTNQAVQVAYAYRIALKNGTFSVGTQIGLYSKAIDYNKLRFNDPNDPNIPTGRIGQAKPDVGFGAYYNTTDYWFGASVMHLNEAAYRLESGRSITPQARTAYLTAGYRLGLGYDLDIQPSVLYQIYLSPTVGTKAASYTVNLLATYQTRFWAGIGYRQADAAILMAGLSLLPNNSLRVGVAYDRTVAQQSVKAPSSLEFLLSYSLPTPDARKKPIIRTPRFRY
jgi:type IX secretion system PorP/SprF family membrane protein